MISHHGYQPELGPALTEHAAKKGILGWTRETRENVTAGKPIYAGFEQNKDFAKEDHRGAELSIRNRVQKLNDALRYGKVHPNDLPAVQSEIKGLLSQQEAHLKSYTGNTAEPAPATDSAVTPPAAPEKSTLLDVLKRLRLVKSQMG